MSEHADLLRDFAIAHAEAARLRKERGDLRCEREEPFEEGTGAGTAPCWRWHPPDEIFSQWYREDDDPCSPCQRREAVHLEYRAAMRRRGTALRRVLHYGRKLLAEETSDD